MSDPAATSAFAVLSRRRFLALLLGSTAVVASCGGGILALRGAAPDVRGLSTLSNHEFRTLIALAQVHTPGSTEALARAFDDFLANEPEANVRDLKRALTLLEFGPMVFELRPVTFSNLEPADRLAHWQSWMWSERHVQRQVATAFRKFLSLVFYDDPAQWDAIGYPGPSFHGRPGTRPPPAPAAPVPGIWNCATAAPPDDQLVDVAVIGSGAGGGTAAWVLAEGGKHVLVLEEGGDRTGAHLTQRDSEYDQLYVDRAGRMTDDLSITILAGRALGGGTVINASDVVPIPDGVLQFWAEQHGLSDFAPSAVAPFAARALQDLSATDIPPAMVNRANQALLDGASRLGLDAHRMMHNRVGCGGMGTCLIGCPLDAKRNTRAVAIPAALSHGAQVHVRARVVRISGHDQEIKTLDVRILDERGYRETGRFTVRARTVVLAANAMGSAELLLRSGIGNAHVGQHLSLQPQLPLIARFDEPITAFRGIPQSVAITEHEVDDDPKRGLWGFRVEGIMGTPGIVSSLLPWPGDKGARMMREYPRIAASLLLTPDRPTGRLYLAGGRAKIDYAIADDLKARWRQAVKVGARVYFAAGAKQVIVPTMPPVVFDDPSQVDAIDAVAFAPATAPLISAHQQGGVRMATDAASGAARPDGLIYGTRGIYCLDSGLYPSSASSHTMTPILTTSRMLASKLL